MGRCDRARKFFLNTLAIVQKILYIKRVGIQRRAKTIMKWTDALVKSVSQKQEAAIVAAHNSNLLNPYALTIDWVRDITESKSPQSPYPDGVMFLGADHEACWSFMLLSSPEDIAADFGRQIQSRRTLDNWAFGDE